MKVYTRTGDDGTTGLFYGGRVAKDDTAPSAYGAVDEAQAFLGLARAEVDQGDEVDELLVSIEADLWVLMAELATAPENQAKLEPGRSEVTGPMVSALEAHIDRLGERFEPPTEFVVPGQNRLAAALLDVARAVVRRAERESLAAAAEGSFVLPYLNRLSDLLWTMARWQEGEALAARAVRNVSD